MRWYVFGGYGIELEYFKFGFVVLGFGVLMGGGGWVVLGFCWFGC
jgi:hypothetical protein